MIRTRIAPRTYVDAAGRYWARFPVNRRYTWKLLRKVTTKRAAIAAAQNATAVTADTFAALAALYEAAGCPNRRLESRTPTFLSGETARLKILGQWFGHFQPEAIRLPLLPQYATWRLRRTTGAANGQRAVDKDFNTLSNVLQYGIAINQIEANHVRYNRPRYRKAAEVNHSRQRMPESADVIHRLSAHFLDSLRSEVFAWLNYFQMFTGCRTSELLRLRLDAVPEAAGHVANSHLHLGRRSKSGVNPYCPIPTEFEKMYECFHRWHAARYPKSPWYFPGPTGVVIHPNSHGHALTRACVALDLPHISPHGFRAYAATKHLREGKTHAEVAGIIGDKTAALIGSTYADCPGGAKLYYVPTAALPSWLRWQSEQQKIAKIA